MLADKLRAVTSGVELPPIGEKTFTQPGTIPWIVPTGVYSICVVCIGGGGGALSYSSGSCPGGGGGGLVWANDLPVTPGQSLTITVGSGGYNTAASTGSGGSGGSSSVTNSLKNWSLQAYGGGGGYRASSASTNGGAGGGYSHTNISSSKGGGNGGSGGGGGGGYRAGGGGAGGYTGSGGDGASTNRSLAGASGSGGGGGGGGSSYSNTTYITGGNGGGTHYFGQGVSGIGGYAGTSANGNSGGYGGQGSFGSGTSYAIQLYDYQPGSPTYSFGGGGCPGASASYSGVNGADGVVRIIWGANRGFPSNKAGPVGDSYLAIANSNYGASVFKFTDSSGFIAQQDSTRDITIRGAIFSKKADAIILIKANAGAYAYYWTDDGFGSNFSNVSFTASSSGARVFSPSGDAVLFADDSTNRISAYKWSKSGFGEKYPNFSSPPSSQVSKVIFSPSGRSLVMLVSSGNFLVSCTWSSQSGFGSYHQNLVNFGNYIYDVVFSPDGSKIIVSAYNQQSRVYEWNDDVGLASSAYTTFGTANGYTLFPPKKNLIARFFGSSLEIYNWSPISGVGSLVSSSSTGPIGGTFTDSGNCYLLNDGGFGRAYTFSTTGLSYLSVTPSLGTTYHSSVGKIY